MRSSRFHSSEELPGGCRAGIADHVVEVTLTDTGSAPRRDRVPFLHFLPDHRQVPLPCLICLETLRDHIVFTGFREDSACACFTVF